MISTVLWLLNDMLYLKTDVNVKAKELGKLPVVKLEYRYKLDKSSSHCGTPSLSFLTYYF